MYTGEKVRLREYRREDIPLAQAYINKAEMKRLLSGSPFLLTLWDEEKFITSLSASQGSNYSFAIETLAEGHYIGGCGFNRLDWKNRNCEIGIFIGDEEYQNKGFGTDAMKILIRLCFNQLNLYKVGLNVLSYNERALKVYRRLGFKEEGRLRQERFFDGAYHDLIIMGLLREEWAQLEKEAL